MKIRALIFDVDGTLADTEEVHRQAFNAAFRQHDIDWDWTPEVYRELLWVTGGKERIGKHIDSLRIGDAEKQQLHALTPLIHATKTHLFSRLIDMGNAPLRPGVARLLAEASARNVPLAIASTTTPANVNALLLRALGMPGLSLFSTIASGDVVANKKPAPDIYLLALGSLRLPAEGCIAFEDSELGVRSAKAAGLFTVAVPTRWTASHDLSAADLILPSLGDDAHPLDDLSAARIGGARMLGLKQLEQLPAPVDAR